MQLLGANSVCMAARSCVICRGAVADTRCYALSLPSAARKRKQASVLFGFSSSHRARKHHAAEPVSRRPTGFLRPRQRPEHSNAAIHADPIAFTQNEAVECEEEDFYSILGVVRNTLDLTCILGHDPHHYV